MRNNILVLMILSFIICGCKKRDRYATKFQRNSELINKSCPVRISNFITMDSTRYENKHNKLYYYFTISGDLDNKKVIEENYDKCKNDLKEAILNSVDMIEYQKHNTTIEYVYFSKMTKEKLVTFTFPLKYRSSRRR